MVIYLRLSLQTLVYCHSDSNIAIRMTAKKKKRERESSQKARHHVDCLWSVAESTDSNPCPTPDTLNVSL